MTVQQAPQPDAGQILQTTNDGNWTRATNNLEINDDLLAGYTAEELAQMVEEPEVGQIPQTTMVPAQPSKKRSNMFGTGFNPAALVSSAPKQEEKQGTFRTPGAFKSLGGSDKRMDGEEFVDCNQNQ